ncbi:hypothetical protein V8C42DRAFT_315176 [Trichoderma barbatum]
MAGRYHPSRTRFPQEITIISRFIKGEHEKVPRTTQRLYPPVKGHRIPPGLLPTTLEKDRHDCPRKDTSEPSSSTEGGQPPGLPQEFSYRIQEWRRVNPGDLDHFRRYTDGPGYDWENGTLDKDSYYTSQYV